MNPDLRALDALVSLGELEATVVRLEHTTGHTPAGVSRPLFPWELTARVDFAAIDRLLATAYAQAATVVDGVRDVITAALGEALAGRSDPREIVAALAGFAATQPPAVRDAINTATTDITRTLAAAFTGAATVLAGEAHTQGVAQSQTGPVVAKLPGLLPVLARRFQPAAAVAPTVAWQKLTAAAVLVDGSRAATPAAVLAGVAAQKLDAAYDVARQAVNVAAGQGRAHTVDGLPTPKQVYSSELLDRVTCDRCASLDGRQYETVGDAYRDYPDAGPMARCRGGDRCRGTLVFVWNEADPTV